MLGDPDGNVTGVEFFDYNCPYCRSVKREIEALMGKAALAAREQGLYEEFHWALIGMQGPANETSVLRIAQEVVLDTDRLQSDMESTKVDEHIQTSMRLAQALGFNGTPSFVIGEALVPDVIDVGQMIELVELAREGD